MRIGIVTLQDNLNVGNRLQNFALQTVIQNLGHAPQSIRNSPYDTSLGAGIRWRFELAKHVGFYSLVSSAISRRAKNIRKNVICKYRISDMKAFSEEYIRYCEVPYRANGDNSVLQQQFDKFIVGSDQVWNPWFHRGSDVDFLRFADSGQRIAYAASFGVSRLPKFVEHDYSRSLMGFSAISVREDAGSAIVETLTGVKPNVVLDPTMLLDVEAWRSLSKVAALNTQSNPLQVFMLPRVSKAHAMMEKIIEKYSALYGWPVERLFEFVSTNFCKVTPWQFIQKVSQAKFLITDSFHCAVFAMLFHIPFKVLGRQDMNSRIDTLLRTFDLDQCRLDPSCSTFDLPEIDWQSVDRILESRREFSLEWLQRNIEHESDECGADPRKASHWHVT